MELAANFNATMTQVASASSTATYKPGSASILAGDGGVNISTTPLTPSTVSSLSPEEAAVEAAGYLGYLALLCVNGSATTPAPATGVSAEVTRIYNLISALQTVFAGQTGSDYTNLKTDIANMQKALGSSSTPTAAQMGAYATIYKGNDPTTASPVGDILTVFSNEMHPSNFTNEDSNFAVATFLTSLYLPGVLATGDAADVENQILGSTGQDPNNPFQSHVNWMAEFLSGYTSLNSTTLFGGSGAASFSAILPASNTSLYPNYSAMLALFNGTTGAGYQKWALDLPTRLQGAAGEALAIQGIGSWFENMIQG